MLLVNFGLAQLIAATTSIYMPDSVMSPWGMLIVFYTVCLLTFAICSLGEKWLPYVDAAASVWNLITILTILVTLSVTAEAGRHNAGYALGHYDTSHSGWGHGFTFFVGLLPLAYTFSAIGMVTSMAEERAEPEVEVSWSLVLCILVGGLASLLFILPICVTLPPIDDILKSPYGQALPFIFNRVLESQTGALVLMVMILLVILLCFIGVTTAAARCTWAFSRDNALPLASVWSRTTAGRPIYALALVTVIQMLLGLINLGNSSAFTAFVSVGVIALALGYLVPIAISLSTGRKEVARARWMVGHKAGIVANGAAVAWILFELVLFSMPTVLPVTKVTMNYASVVLVGFAAMSDVWYLISGRKRKCSRQSADVCANDL
jgi:amino acid transporter